MISLRYEESCLIKVGTFFTNDERMNNQWLAAQIKDLIIDRFRKKQIAN